MRLGDIWRRSIVYLGHGVTADPSGISVAGTGFLLSTGEPGGNYLVTAGHVAKGLGEPVFDIRLNEKSGGPGRIDQVEPNWFWHPDDTVDLAVMQYEPPDWADVFWMPANEVFLSAQKLKTKDTGPGDFTYVVGVLHFAHGKGRNMPAVHTGHIVLMPDSGEKIAISDWRAPDPKKVPAIYVDAYLIQCDALPGSSGSPVFIRRTLQTKITAKEIQPAPLVSAIPGSVWFLGVWRGAWFGRAADELNLPQHDNRVPYGLGSVVPATKLKEVLGSPKLKALRATALAAHKAPKLDAPLGLTWPGALNGDRPRSVLPGTPGSRRKSAANAKRSKRSVKRT